MKEREKERDKERERERERERKRKRERESFPQKGISVELFLCDDFQVDWLLQLGRYGCILEMNN